MNRMAILSGLLIWHWNCNILHIWWTVMWRFWCGMCSKAVFSERAAKVTKLIYCVGYVRCELREGKVLYNNICITTRTRYGNNNKSSSSIWYLTKLDSLRYNMNSSYVSWFLVLYFIVTYPMVFDIRIRSVPWVRRFFASSVCAFTTPGGRISQVPTCTRQYYTILCLLLYAIPRRLIVVYWPHTLTHPLASLPSVTTYFISSISNQTETYSFFESTTKAYPLYHWCVDLIL